MQSKATTVVEYINALPDDRRPILEAVRKIVLDNLDPTFQECMQYGMIGYSVPHSVFPAGYHCDPKQPLPFAGLASQKGHLSLYVMGLYMDPVQRGWFLSAWAKSGKKLNMGAACIRFKKLDDLPLEVVAQVFQRITAKGYIAMYEKNLASQKSRPGGGAKKPAAAGAKKAAGKTAKKAASKTMKKAAGKTVKKAAAKTVTKAKK